MTTLNFSPSFMDSLGGVGARALGEQFGLAQQTQQQQNLLGQEQVLASQQKRKFDEENRPYELAKLKFEVEQQPEKARGDKLRNRELEQKIDGKDFSNFTDDLLQLQLDNSPADLSYMGVLAKKHNLDINHPMVRKAIEALQAGPEVFKKFQDKVYATSPEARKLTQQGQNRLAEIREMGINRLDQIEAKGEIDKAIAQLRLDGVKFTAQQKHEASLAEKAMFGKTYDQAAIALNRIADLELLKGPTADTALAQYYRGWADYYTKLSLVKSPTMMPGAGRLDMSEAGLPTNPPMQVPTPPAPLAPRGAPPPASVPPVTQIGAMDATGNNWGGVASGGSSSAPIGPAGTPLSAPAAPPAAAPVAPAAPAPVSAGPSRTPTPAKPNETPDQFQERAKTETLRVTGILAYEYNKPGNSPERKKAAEEQFKDIVKRLPPKTRIIGLDGKEYTVN